MGQIVYQALVWLLLVQGCFASHSTPHSLVNDTPCDSYGDLMVTIKGGEIACGGKRSYRSLMSAENPKFRYRAAKEDELYTMMMFHTGRPGCETNLDYMISNVMGSDLAKDDTYKEDIFSFYNRPSIKQKAKLRYFMYAFEQQYPLEGIAFSSSLMCKFDADKFVGGRGLKPVAANMFTTKQ